MKTWPEAKGDFLPPAGERVRAWDSSYGVTCGHWFSDPSGAIWWILDNRTGPVSSIEGQTVPEKWAPLGNPADIEPEKSVMLHFEGWTVDLFICDDGRLGISVDQPNPGMPASEDSPVPCRDIFVTQELDVTHDGDSRLTAALEAAERLAANYGYNATELKLFQAGASNLELSVDDWERSDGQAARGHRAVAEYRLLGESGNPNSVKRACALLAKELRLIPAESRTVRLIEAMGSYFSENGSSGEDDALLEECGIK